MRMEPRILGTVCVPWTERFEFDEARFRRVVRDLLGKGLKDLYVFGTAGEGHAVDDRQFRAVAGTFFDEMKLGGGLCQLGVIGLSVPQVKARIEMGLELGFRSFQISFPSWGAVNNREMQLFFDAILGAYPACEFLHYNLLRGLRKMTGREYAEVAARHANLVATKSGGNAPAQILGLLRHAPELCHFMTELDFSMASLFGEAGLLISLGALNPRRARAFFEAARRQDREAIAAAAREYSELLELVLQSVKSGAHMDGAYDKLFVKAALPDFPLRLLPPYQGASDEEFSVFQQALKSRFPQWMEG